MTAPQPPEAEPERPLLPDSDYGPALTCTLPLLRTDGVPVNPGTSWTCPDCGANWVAKGFLNWGGVQDVQWVCSNPPGFVNPLPGRVSSLEGRVAAAEARDSALQLWLAALDSREASDATRLTSAEGRLAAVESRTLILHRATWAPTVALAIGKTDVALTWPTAFTAGFVDANYRLEVTVLPTVATKVTAVEKSRTKDGVVITLTAAAVIAIGTAVLDVIATRFGSPA